MDICFSQYFIAIIAPQWPYMSIWFRRWATAWQPVSSPEPILMFFSMQPVGTNHGEISFQIP